MEKQANSPPVLITRKEAAEKLSVSLRTLGGLVASGQIAPVRIGRSVRFRPETLEAFVKSREAV